MLFNQQPNLPKTGDELADRLISIISDRVGITGWEIARAVNNAPEQVETKLNELLQKDLVKAEGSGLNAYYAPSRSFAKVRISGVM